MVFVIQLHVLRQLALDVVLYLVIVGVEVDPSVPGEDAVGVGVDDETGQSARVEQDRIGRFRPDTVNAEQPAAQLRQFGAEHRLQRAIVLLDDKFEHAPQPPGLDAEVTGRLNQLFEFFDGHVVQCAGFEQIGLAEVVDRPFDVPPTGVLREHGADDDLEGRFARPPVLGSKGVKQAAVGFG